VPARPPSVLPQVASRAVALGPQALEAVTLDAHLARADRTPAASS
jgi:hypothetical protein